MTTRPIKIRIRIVVEPDKPGFHAYCPDLKGLHVDGATEDEAVSNAKEAAAAYLRSLRKHNEPIPVGVLAPDATTPTGKPTRARPHVHVEELSVPA